MKGYIVKSKTGSKVSDEDLKLINKLTRRNFSEDEVYIFSVVLCDNDIDREHERFTDTALEKLSELFVGKTGILDHNPTSDNQTARIYSCNTEFVKNKVNRLGEPYKRLLAKAYMPKSSKNENIILEIDSGIKKEVSVGCSVNQRICSICGKDVGKENCAHIKGHRYKTSDGYKICHTVLDDPTDAYEWSFVAVPAQREAGVIKSFTLTKDGGDMKMEDIIKSLSYKKSITFSDLEAKKLFEYIENLRKKSLDGEFYKDELKNEVLKLSAAVQPELDIQVMKNVADKLNIKELKSFRDSFKSKLLKSFPSKPQFAKENNNHTFKDLNQEFKI